MIFVHVPSILGYVYLLLHLVEIHKVTILDAQGCPHTLNRYNAMWDKPRPESSTKVCVVC